MVIDGHQFPFRQCFARTGVPDKIIRKAHEECWYLELSTDGSYLPHSWIGKRNIIVFRKGFFNWCEKRRVFAILHETAHYHKKHKCKIEGISDGAWENQEKVANTLARKWMKGWSESERLKDKLDARLEDIRQAIIDLVDDLVDIEDQQLNGEFQERFDGLRKLVDKGEQKLRIASGNR